MKLTESGDDMARRYDVEGTKTYLIAALVLLVLALWFVWDGWFPREAVLAKHPDYPADSFYAFNRVTGVIFFI
ncbi:MAG: hypothetical protein KJ626_08160, partial [Verrucomicrobia bacterium]|nr:hypothetical protein [Verrucomicrobiota bacterium]